MRADELERVRVELDEFVSEVFASLTRKDQRAKGSLYLQGVMLEGRRKSMQPMGDRLGIDYQQLQQFVSSSPWRVEPVRKVLARKAIAAIGPQAWVVDDTGFVKDGPASPGVARQYSGTIGKVGNVQVAVSVHAVTDQASCPLGWRLFLPQNWDDVCSETSEHAARVAERRAKARIPDTVRNRPKWELALEAIDELRSWGQRPPLMVADAGYGEIGYFRTALTEREIPYVVQVKSETSMHHVDEPFVTPAYSGRGRPPVPGYQAAPIRADMAGYLSSGHDGLVLDHFWSGRGDQGFRSLRWDRRPEPGSRLAVGPPGGLGLDVGEDAVRFGRAEELIKTVGVSCRVQRVVERRVVEADMRGLVTAGPCVRLERAAGLRTSVALRSTRDLVGCS